MPLKSTKIELDLVNKVLVVSLLFFGFFILGFTLYRLVRPAPKKTDLVEILTSQPQEIAIFLLGDSSYLFSKDIDGHQHIINYLDSYLDSRLNCSYSLLTPSINEFDDSHYRIWGDPFERDELGIPKNPIDRDINTIPMFISAKNFVSTAVSQGKKPLVVLGFGTNESKDINNPDTAKTIDKFHTYLNGAKSILESLGAVVLIATPVKGCPFTDRNYEPEGMLKTLAENILTWYSNTADIFTAFKNHSCSNTDPCPGPDPCLTRCLINVSPFNSPGFPDRTCQEDYIHPNNDGYNLMANTIGQSVVGLNLCPEEPTSTPLPAATPTPINENDQNKLKKGDLNLDEIVNSIDWSIMKSHFFSGNKLEEGDLNEDGVINSLDWSIMKSHFWENV